MRRPWWFRLATTLLAGGVAMYVQTRPSAAQQFVILFVLVYLFFQEGTS
jgi:hypothetical protein